MATMAPPEIVSLSGDMIYVVARFCLLIDNRRFEYRRGLYRRRDIPPEHIGHTYAASFMADPDEDQEREEFQQPREIPLAVPPQRKSKLDALRRRKVSA